MKEATFKGFRPLLCALVLTVLTLSAFATERPFKMKGTTLLALTSVDTNGVLTFAMNGAGTGTHVGKWTNTGSFVLGPTGNGTGTIALIAANGDHLLFTAAGTADQTGNVVAIYTINGGTGRFAGVCGSGISLVS